MRMDITRKIKAILLLVLIVALFNIVIIYVYQAQQRSDAHIVNVAGRQRALSLIITRYALSVARDHDYDHKFLLDAIEAYDSSLEALWHGGKVMKVDIPPAPKAEEELYQRNKNLWAPFKENLKVIEKESTRNISFQEAVSYVKDKNEKLLQASNDIVTAYEKLSDPALYIHEINVARRQELLSQQIAKYVFSIAIGNGEDREDLNQAAELFDKSLQSMRDGGVSIPLGKAIQIPPPSVRKFITDLEDLWEPFRVKINVIHQGSGENKIYKEAIGYIADNNEDLIASSNQITTTLVERVSRKYLILRTLLIIMLGIVILIFIVGYFLAVKITKPLRDLFAFAGRIVSGDFTAKAPSNNEDEIGELGAALNKITKDITEHKQAEDVLKTNNQQLEESNQQLKANLDDLSEKSKDLTAAKEDTERSLKEVKDEIGELGADFNKISENLIEHKQAEDVLKTNNQQLEESNQQLKANLDDLSEKSGELTAAKEDTERSLKETKDEIGELGADFNKIIEDLTKHKQAEGALKANNQQLEESNQQLKANLDDLSEKSGELTAAKDDAEQLLKEMRDKNSELSTSLNKITKDTIGQKQTENTLEADYQQLEDSNLQLEKSNQKIEIILNDLSNKPRDPIDARKPTSFGKMSSGLIHKINSSFELKFSEVEVNGTINSAVSLLGEQLRSHEIEVILELDNDLPKISAEPYQLEQVWANFISNARDALDEKEVMITYSNLQEEDYSKKLIIMTSYDQETNIVEVSFTDNGLGISEEVQTKIFEPFFTTKKASKAMGLGLSTSYDIIKNHKGTIEVESEEGKGTMITATLPL